MSKKNIKNNIIPKDIDLQSLLREKKNELKKFEMNYRPISYWGLNSLWTFSFEIQIHGGKNHFSRALDTYGQILRLRTLL